MLQNDPLLVFLVQRLHLTPFAIGIITLILLPCVLFVWCWRSGTMRLPASMANPEGHGFLSPINSYLLMIPFLNFAIFQYYDIYASTIRDLCQRDVLRDHAEEIFSILGGPAATWATGVSFAVSFFLALASILWNKYWQRPKLTNWLCRTGIPRPVAFYFHFQFFFIELAIIFNWVLRNILIWWRLNESIGHSNAQPFNPDHMFGLAAISVLAQWSFFVIALISLFVLLWIIGARITFKRRSLYSNPAYISAAVAIFLIGPTAVIFPLRSSHQVMLHTQAKQLTVLSSRIEQISDEIQRQVSSPDATESQIANLTKKLEAENHLYDMVESSSTWPISSSTLGSFPFAFLSPVLVPILVEAGKRYMPRALH
jgi:hypothetical protein